MRWHERDSTKTAGGISAYVTIIYTVFAILGFASIKEMWAVLERCLPINYSLECDKTNNDPDDISNNAENIDIKRGGISDPEYVMIICKEAANISDKPKHYHQLARAERAQAENLRKRGETDAARRLDDQEMEHERNAADRGYAPAQARYGELLIVNGKTQEGTEYLKRAIEGSAHAQCLIGQYYWSGINPYIPESTDKAVHLFAGAAKNGSLICQKFFDMVKIEYPHIR